MLFAVCCLVSWSVPAICQNPDGFRSDVLSQPAIDSLLIRGRYDQALTAVAALRDSLDKRRERANNVDPLEEEIDAYTTLITQLIMVPSAAESLVNAYAQRATTVANKFSVEEAGIGAHGCYREFQEKRDSLHLVTAYQRYLLADFLRLHHIQQDKQRCLDAYQKASRYVSNKHFDEFDTLLTSFRAEMPTIAFLQVYDDLVSRYEKLAERVARERDELHYEQQRDAIPAGSFSFSVGLAVAPSFRLSHENIGLTDPLDGTPVRGVEGSPVTSAGPAFLAKAGIAVLERFVVGVSFLGSVQNFDGLLTRRNASTRAAPYKGKLRYQVVDLFFRYLSETRTGFRPFAEISVGSFLVQQKSLADPPLVGGLLVEEKNRSAPQLSIGTGTEYLPFNGISVFLLAYGKGEFVFSKPDFVSPLRFNVGLMVGLAM